LGTAFYFSCDEVFTRPGAQAHICFSRVETAAEKADTVADKSGTPSTVLAAPKLAWEYWNGDRWAVLLTPPGDAPANFAKGGQVSFVVPSDLTPVTVEGVNARWIRVRLAEGNYDR